MNEAIIGRIRLLSALLFLFLLIPASAMGAVKSESAVAPKITYCVVKGDTTPTPRPTILSRSTPDWIQH